MIALIREEIRKALSRRVHFAFAEVTSVDWARQLARVRIATTGQQTSWLRIAASAAGQLRPIRRGDEVSVLFPDGNPAGPGVIVNVLYGAARPPDFPENAYGWQQGDAKVLFDAQGKVTWQSVSTVSISSTSSISLDGTQISLGQGAVSAGVKYEELQVAETSANAAQNAAIAAWLLALAAAANVAFVPVVPGKPFLPPPLALPPPVLTPSRSAKVRLV